MATACVDSLSVSSRTFTSVYRVAVHVGLSYSYRLRQNNVEELFSGCANFTMQRVANEASREKNSLCSIETCLWLAAMDSVRLRKQQLIFFGWLAFISKWRTLSDIFIFARMLALGEQKGREKTVLCSLTCSAAVYLVHVYCVDVYCVDLFSTGLSSIQAPPPPPRLN